MGFSTLVAAVAAAGLVDVLAGDGTFTVFAPTNDAFANLPDGTLDSLLQPENVQQLTDILLYHVLGSVVTSSDLYDGLSATTLQGSDVTIMVTGGVMINDANVIVADVLASNGIVHVIDAVLIPGGDSETPDSVTVSCGNPANNNCMGDYCSPNDELHEVRCCSDSQIDNYQQRNDCEVWAESQFLSVGEGGDGCVHDAPLVTAIEVCMMEGARH